MDGEESLVELEHQGAPHMPETARLCQPSLTVQMRVSQEGTARELAEDGKVC